MGDGGVKVKELLSSISSPVPLSGLLSQSGMTAKVKGDKDFSEAGNSTAELTLSFSRSSLIC